MNPFYIDSEITLFDKNYKFLINNFLNVFINANPDLLGNLDGSIEINLKNLKNSIINNGKINLIINEKTLKLKNALFEIDKVGIIKSKFKYYENEGEMIFSSNNCLEINNKKEFSKKFQISQSKLKKINKIFFDFESNIDNEEISISNIHINKIDKEKQEDEFYIIKNIQEFRNLLKQILI